MNFNNKSANIDQPHLLLFTNWLFLEVKEDFSVVSAKECSMTLWNPIPAVTNYLTPTPVGKITLLSTRVALPINVICVIHTHLMGSFKTNCRDIFHLERQSIIPGE
jgi:hypothetical protein